MFDDNGNGNDILSIPENSLPSKKQEFKDDLNFVIDKKNLRGFYNINSGSSEVINTEFSSTHKSKFSEIDEISSIKDYHNYQLSKKDNVKDKTNYLEKGYNEKDLRFKNKGNIKNDNNIIHDSLLEANTFNDLFGTPHKVQHTIYSSLVSRGYPMARIDGSLDEANIGYENEDKTKENISSEQTAVICKSCPIPVTQTYQFLNPEDPNFSTHLKQLNVVENDPFLQNESGRYRNKYYHEVGGSYLGYKYDEKSENFVKDNCKVCDYPAGCYNPARNRRDLYETQACKQGKNRVCSKCGVCYQGEEKVVSFCGEGRNADTKCERRTLS